MLYFATVSITTTIIVPYFGKFPFWSELYFYSVSKNPEFQFIFYTDCDYSQFESISNATFIPISFEEYVLMVKSRLKYRINIPNPYKICDLRPFFGIVHQDLIQDSDFYGWSDMDIVYGNIGKFYTRAILSRYDILSTHSNRLSGHFALLRNKSKYVNSCHDIYNVSEALANNQFIGIDEDGLTNAILMSSLDRIIEKFRLSSMKGISNRINKIRHKRYYFREQYTTPFLPIPWLDGSLNSDQPSTWFYDGRRITNSRDGDKEFMYLHFMNFKSSKYRHDKTIAPWELSPPEYHVDLSNISHGLVIDENGFKMLA